MVEGRWADPERSGRGEETRLVVKRLLPHLEGDRAAASCVVREAELLRLLPSPPAPRLLAADLSGPSPWFAMDRVAGRSLDDAVAALGWATVAYALAEAVAVLHAAAGPDGQPLGLAHGDLKPAHVVVRGDAKGPTVFLLDYGNARLATPPNTPVTGCGTGAGGLGGLGPEPTGSPAWMAPERRAGGAPSQAADVHALGAMIWEQLTGLRFHLHGERARTVKGPS